MLIPNIWLPRIYQRPAWAAWRKRGIRRSLLVWHRRAGKDDVALHKAAVAAHVRVATYWHLLPEYEQARKAIWAAVNPHTGMRRIDEAFPLELRESTDEQEMFIRFKIGSTWQVIGCDNYDSLVGTPPAGIVFSEWAQANPVRGAIWRRSWLRTTAGRSSSRRREGATTPSRCSRWAARLRLVLAAADGRR